MAKNHAPPSFIKEPHEYLEYRKRLQRWSRITKVEKKHQAEVVVYNLEGDPSGIQEKIDTALGDQIVEKEDGMEKLIEYLDRIYKEDDMTTAWLTFREFIRVKKNESQTISMFIADYEKHVQKAKEVGCTFSDTVLAFFLLDACQLQKLEENFVLTGIDFTTGKTQKNLLEQMKSSLKKFQSRVLSEVRTQEVFNLMKL